MELVSEKETYCKCFFSSRIIEIPVDRDVDHMVDLVLTTDVAGSESLDSATVSVFF